MIWDSGEPRRKRKTITKAVKDTVWNKYIGSDKTEGECYVCQRPIHIQQFEVGHNKARAKGGSDNVTNLRPICSSCNKSMGTMSIETFKAKHFSKAKRAGEKPAELVGKMKVYLYKLGYEMASKKYGFDLCAKKEGGMSDRDSYILIGFNTDRTVTAAYIGDFMKKAIKSDKRVSDTYIFGSPRVEGLIAYTGELSKDIAALVRDSKPPIKFKKF